MKINTTKTPEDILAEHMMEFFKVSEEIAQEQGTKFVSEENFDELMFETINRMKAKEKTEATTMLEVEQINEMLTEAFEENDTEFFTALNCIYTKASITCSINGVSSFSQCREDMQAYLLNDCLKELVNLTTADEKGCHLIAYTLKAIEVNPSPKHFKGPVKLDVKQLITEINQFMLRMTSEMYIETKEAQYLEGFHNAQTSDESWKKILKLYNEIYNPHFDIIW